MLYFYTLCSLQNGQISPPRPEGACCPLNLYILSHTQLEGYQCFPKFLRTGISQPNFHRALQRRATQKP